MSVQAQKTHSTTDTARLQFWVGLSEEGKGTEGKGSVHWSTTPFPSLPFPSSLPTLPLPLHYLGSTA